MFGSYPRLRGADKKWIISTMGATLATMPREHWLEVCAVPAVWGVPLPHQCSAQRRTASTDQRSLPVYCRFACGGVPQACLDADVPCAPVSSYAEIGDPSTSVGRHLAENGYVGVAGHREWGEMLVVPHPTDFRGTPPAPPSAEASWHGPEIGEHTTEALLQLGYSEAEADALVREGVTPPATGPHSTEGKRRIAAARARARRAEPSAKL